LEGNLQTSLWKDHSDEPETPDELRSLKERYVADGHKAADHLKKACNVLAAWLSGPFESSRVSPTSDLHLAVLIRSGKHSFYHHQLPHLSEVGRRLEIAYFPLEYLESIFKNGYSRWADVFDLHKLNNVEILFEKGEVLSRMRKRLADVRPRRLFVGRQLEELREQFLLLERLLDGKKHEEVVLSARKIMLDSLMLSVLMADGHMSSKLSHLYSRLEFRYPPSVADMFRFTHLLAESDPRSAAELVRQTKDLVKLLFERQGVCGGGSN
jgi:hypothetical protein